MLTTESARKLLTEADVFFDLYGDDDPEMSQTLNMNDVWCWASADGCYVPDEKLSEVGELFMHYGWCGILYWVSEQSGGMKSDFHDINRFIEFVRQEEKIKKKIPSSTKRAFKKFSYRIGKRSWYLKFFNWK